MPAPLSPEKLDRRARIFGFVMAPVYALMGVGFVILGLGFWPILVGGLTLIVLAILLVTAGLTPAPALRWIAVAVGVLGGATASTLAFTGFGSDLGLAVTYLLGILPIIGLATFVVVAVSRARRRG